MNTKITKDLLIKKMTDTNDLTQKANKEALDTIMKIIPEILAQGDEVSLYGFGSFKVIDRQARQGYNPTTGNRIHIEERKMPRFRAGKPFKDLIANA